MVNFNFSYAPGTSLQQMVGFETAGRIWSSLLTDNVTLNIYAGVSSSLPSNTIGGALPAISAHQSYSSVVNGLKKDVTSADDLLAVGSLDWGSIYSAQFDMYYGSNPFNSGVRVTTDNINLTSANAKAIGLVSATNTALDGVILFGGLQGSSYSWNYDYARSGAASANSLDFLSTAIHEIGHILGFVSGVDKPGWLNSKIAYTAPTAVTDYITSLYDRITYTTPLDLFRYSSNFSYTNDLSYGSNGSQSGKYFSITKGVTSIASFSTGVDKSLGGDGNQASHWKDGTAGVLDPTLAGGERLSISQTDLRAFDAIGWNLKSTTGVPSLDLSALKSQSDQALAQRLGTTVASLYANVATSETKLSFDQSVAVDTMIKNSQIYNWGVKPPVTAPTPTLPPSVSQVLGLLQNQTVYGSFDTLDDKPTSTGGAAPSVDATIKSGQIQNQGTKSSINLPSLNWTTKPPINYPTLPPSVNQVIDLLQNQDTKSSINLPSLNWTTKPPINYPTLPPSVNQVTDLALKQVVQSPTSVSNSSNSSSTTRKLDLSQDLITVNTVDLLAL